MAGDDDEEKKPNPLEGKMGNFSQRIATSLKCKLEKVEKMFEIESSV